MTPTEIATTTDQDLNFTDITELDEACWQNAQLIEPTRAQYPISEPPQSRRSKR